MRPTEYERHSNAVPPNVTSSGFKQEYAAGSVILDSPLRSLSQSRICELTQEWTPEVAVRNPLKEQTLSASDTTSDSGRLKQMDGLRGLAMLFVFVGHFGITWSQLVHPAGTPSAFLRLVDADAALGSGFFMLLSGFFAYGSLMRGRK